MLYQCSAATAVGTAALTVVGNVFSSGYYPDGGNYGVDAYTFCSAPSTTWSGNVWDGGGGAIGC